MKKAQGTKQVFCSMRIYLIVCNEQPHFPAKIYKRIIVESKKYLAQILTCYVIHNCDGKIF